MSLRAASLTCLAYGSALVIGTVPIAALFLSDPTSEVYKGYCSLLLIMVPGGIYLVCIGTRGLVFLNRTTRSKSKMIDL